MVIIAASVPTVQPLCIKYWKASQSMLKRSGWSHASDEQACVLSNVTPQSSRRTLREESIMTEDAPSEQVKRLSKIIDVEYALQ